jgi:hypothetical protein
VILLITSFAGDKEVNIKTHHKSQQGRSTAMTISRMVLVGVSIAMSGLSLACSVFNLTHDLFPTASLGSAYFVVRMVLEFGPRLLQTSRKLALATLAFAMIVGHAFIGTTVGPHEHGPFEFMRLLVCALGFFGPEVVVWALAISPPVHGTYRLLLRKPLLIPLPTIDDRDSYEIRMSGPSLDHLSFPDYIAITILNSSVAHDLGILRRPGHASSPGLPGGSYQLSIANHAKRTLDIKVEVYIRTIHLV